jgi:hypothetical protein
MDVYLLRKCKVFIQWNTCILSKCYRFSLTNWTHEYCWNNVSDHVLRKESHQGSPNWWEPGRFGRFPVLLVRPGSQDGRKPVPNHT